MKANYRVQYAEGHLPLLMLNIYASLVLNEWRRMHVWCNDLTIELWWLKCSCCHWPGLWGKLKRCIQHKHFKSAFYSTLLHPKKVFSRDIMHSSRITRLEGRTGLVWFCHGMFHVQKEHKGENPPGKGGFWVQDLFASGAEATFSPLLSHDCSNNIWCLGVVRTTHFTPVVLSCWILHWCIVLGSTNNFVSPFSSIIHLPNKNVFIYMMLFCYLEIYAMWS